MGRLGLLVVLVARVAAADDELDVPGLDAADLRGDALMWEDATLFLEPWDSGAKIQAFGSFGKRRDEVGRAIPVRIVDSTSRTFVEVQLPARSDCTWRKLVADPRIEGLRLFVRREDLAPVLTKPFAIQYSDGTRIKLAAGVPVAPTTSGDYVVPAHMDRFRLPIPHGSVGYLYKPGKAGDPEPPAGKFVRIDRIANVKLGDDTVQVKSAWYAPAPDKRGTDETQVKLTARCLEMVVSVPSNALRPSEAPRPIPQNPIGGAPSSVGWRIPAGAPLSTPGGREVGVAAAAINVTAPTADSACFDAVIRLLKEDEYYSPQPRNFRLCAPAALVER